MSIAVQLVIHSARVIDSAGDRENYWVSVDAEKIIAAGHGSGWREFDASHVVDAGGKILTPGFVDIHTHGAVGTSFDDPEGNAQAALDFHMKSGSTSVVTSLVSSPVEKLAERLSFLAQLHHPAFVGSHLEGPFLDPEHRGAHALDALTAPTNDSVVALLKAAAGTLRQITVAPELPGVATQIPQFLSAGVTVAVGHTGADYDVTNRAFAAGARLLTHAFNAMPGLHHRDPGPVAAALDHPDVVLELIFDGTHVHPSIARMLFELAPTRVALVSDAMTATGCHDGEYALGSVDVYVKDGIARVTSNDAIAGSTITLSDAVRIAIVECGIPPYFAVGAATITPARAIGLTDRGMVSPGLRADLVLLNELWQVEKVWLAGSELSLS